MSYTQYSELGELWLPTIPSQWDSRKIKYTFSERSEKGYPEEPLLVASQNMGVVPKGVYGNRTVEATKDLQNLKLVRVGDFVISLRSFQGGLEYAYYQGIISPAYTVMIPNEHITGGYFKYLAKSRLFIELLQMCVTGIREGQNIDYEKLKNHHIPLPPRAEQDQIVRYLDWKVSQVNRLINAKKKQIGLLQEQKRGIINTAVTKGLNPDVPMKNSGVDWLGSIPDHYKVCKLKNLASFQSGINLTALEIQDEGNYPVFGGNGQRGFYPEFLYDGEFLLIGRQGALCGNVHHVTGQFWATEHAVTVKPTPFIDIRWLFYMLDVMNLNQYSRAAAQPGLSVEYITNVSTFFSPIDEQRQIALLLDDKCTGIDRLINIINTEITLLHEYRTCLISDVVTGKLDVRGVAVPEFEVVEEAATEDEAQGEDEPTDTEEE